MNVEIGLDQSFTTAQIQRLQNVPYPKESYEVVVVIRIILGASSSQSPASDSSQSLVGCII
jgi:hypothetical protein